MICFENIKNLKTVDANAPDLFEEDQIQVHSFNMTFQYFHSVFDSQFQRVW